MGECGRGTYSMTAIAQIAALFEGGAYPRPPITAIAMMFPITPPRYRGRRPTLSPKYHVNGMMRRARQNPPILMSNAWITDSPPRVRKYMFWVRNALPIKLLPSWRRQTVRVRRRSVPLKQS
jgi:hypothetical protein